MGFGFVVGALRTFPAAGSDGRTWSAKPLVRAFIWFGTALIAVGVIVDIFATLEPRAAGAPIESRRNGFHAAVAGSDRPRFISRAHRDRHGNLFAFGLMRAR